MSSLWLLTVVLLAVMAAAQQNGGNRDGDGGDFAFDVTDDFEVEITAPFPAKTEITAVVGKIVNIVVPKDVFGKDIKGYEVRTGSLSLR